MAAGGRGCYPAAVRRSLVWLALGLGFTACGGAPRPETPSAPAPRIVRASDGAELTFDGLVDALAPARVVLLGERHDQAGDHEMQRAVTAALLDRSPSTALGFEMFQRPYQAPLDAYQAGAIDEDAMLAQTEWADRWGYDFAMYRPLVAFGPSRGARLLALNAPREVTRRVAREGIGSLGQPVEGQPPAIDVTELDLGDQTHRALVNAAFQGHPGMTSEVMERFYAAQVVWDETMASAVAEHLASPDAASRVIVYAGAMHVMRPAIPARVERRADVSTAIVLPVSPEDLEEARELADFLWVAPAE